MILLLPGEKGKKELTTGAKQYNKFVHKPFFIVEAAGCHTISYPKTFQAYPTALREGELAAGSEGEGKEKEE